MRQAESETQIKTSSVVFSQINVRSALRQKTPSMISLWFSVAEAPNHEHCLCRIPTLGTLLLANYASEYDQHTRWTISSGINLEIMVLGDRYKEGSVQNLDSELWTGHCMDWMCTSLKYTPRVQSTYTPASRFHLRRGGVQVTGLTWTGLWTGL